MRLDPRSADCRVFTFKEGPLSPLGHDLELRVTRFSIDVDGETVEATFDTASLQVVAAQVNGRADLNALSARDCRSIESTIAEEVLRAKKYPQIGFRSTVVSADEVRGTLTLAGRSREIICRREREGTRQVATARIVQPEFGITPYRAMLGALRVRAEVLVRVSLEL